MRHKGIFPLIRIFSYTISSEIECKLVSMHKWPFLSALRLDSPPFGRVPGFLDLAQKFSFMDWKLTSAQNLFMDGHKLILSVLLDDETIDC